MKGRIDIPIIFAASLVCISVVTPDPVERTKGIHPVVSQKLAFNGLITHLQYALITIAQLACAGTVLTKIVPTFTKRWQILPNT